MSERFKYAKNGICRVENFAEHLAPDTFPEVELGQLCGMKWYSELEVSEDGTKIYPLIYCDHENAGLKHNVQIYYNLLNSSNKNKKEFKKVEKIVLSFDEDSIGFEIPIVEILDLKNGWLDAGTLSFEYGIQVLAIMKNKLWRFNFNDKLFNGGTDVIEWDNTDDPISAGPLYAHKILPTFHSEELASSGGYIKVYENDEDIREKFIICLQICHGVRLHLNQNHGSILTNADSLQMFNVISYCDWYLVHVQPWEVMKDYANAWILFADKFKLRHFLVFILKSMTSLKGNVSEEDVEKMSNGTIKMFIAKFLYEKF